MSNPNEYSSEGNKSTQASETNLGYKRDSMVSIELDTKRRYSATLAEEEVQNPVIRNQLIQSEIFGGDIWEKYTNVALGNYIGYPSDFYQQSHTSGDGYNQGQHHRRESHLTNIVLQPPPSVPSQNSNPPKNSPPKRLLFDSPEPNPCFWLVLLLYFVFIVLVVIQIILR